MIAAGLTAHYELAVGDLEIHVHGIGSAFVLVAGGCVYRYVAAGHVWRKALEFDRLVANSLLDRVGMVQASEGDLKGFLHFF
jgi:hypothetical protein